MHRNSLVAAALLASGASALVVKRAGPDGCADTLDDQPYVADVGYFSDQDCNEQIGSFCLYTYANLTNSGDYGCNSAGLPATTPFYVKMQDTPKPDIQLVYTQDQTCPPNGPGAVFATLIDNQNCVLFNKGGDAPGVSIYPAGGAAVAKKRSVFEAPAKRAVGSSGKQTNLISRPYPADSPMVADPAPLRKRDGKCSGFNIESQTPSESQSVQVSNIVDCVNGGDNGCTITEGQEHTESVSTSYSVTAGGGIEGLFEVSATFGMEYTESSTTSIQEGFSIPGGQKGYLSAYSAATLFKGTFTGCDTGDAEQPGQALVIKTNGFTYSTVLTGA